MRKKQPRPTGSGATRDSVYVDTSAWIAFFSIRDQNHLIAARLFREAVARNILLITTNLVLAEAHRLVLHRVGMVASNYALHKIESSSRVSIVFAGLAHHTAAKAWLDKLKSHRITYTDAIGFVIIEEVRCVGFVSFDSDFLLAGFHPWAPI